MKNKQGFSSLVFIIIIVLILGGGYWVWKGKTEAPAPVADTNIEPPPPVNFFTTKIDTVNLPADQFGWKTYTNEQY